MQIVVVEDIWLEIGDFIPNSIFTCLEINSNKQVKI